MENRSNNFLVGAVTILLMLAVAGFAVWLANASGGQKKKYDIFFKQSVDGLNKGAAVLFSGVPAGQVREIALWKPDPQYVRVRIEVDEDIPVLQGTTATMQGVGFTGVSQIMLDGAVKGAPAITQKGPAGVPVIPTRLGGLGELLNNAPQLLERLTTLTERLTELANDRNQQSLGNTLANVDRLTSRLAQNRELEIAITEARIAAQQAGTAAAQIGKVAGSADVILNEEGRPAVAELKATLESAQASIKSLETAINDARPGLQNFSQTTIPQANALVRDLRQTSASLSSIAERLDQGGATAILGSPKLPDYEGKKK